MRSSTVAIVAVFTSIAVWACSSAPAPAPAPSTQKDANLAGGDGTPKASSPGASAAAASGSTTPGGTTPGAGGDKAGACEDACDQKHPAGATKFGSIDQVSQTCTCGAAVCGTACGPTSVCKDDGPDPADGDACATCLDGAAASSCDQQSEASCKADPDCAALATCYDACGDDDDDAGAK